MPKTIRNKFNEVLTYEKFMNAHLKCKKGKKFKKQRQ